MMEATLQHAATIPAGFSATDKSY